jgi:cysteinyl-tRNA synthetase
MLRLFDTATGAVRELAPREPGKVSIYACGPTVYGPPHIGHGRTVLAYDILRRYLEWAGNEVTFVSNVTDIDDNIIRRAEAEGRTPEDVAAACEAEWFRGMDALGIRRPDRTPHATEYVEAMVELVRRLVERGVAYETSDGVYLEVEKVQGYGLLAGQPLESLRAGARIEASEEKRSPLDFVLWKKAKPGEPRWPSPWGEGRPGWHTECVVMSLDLLGEGFDIHGGGQDLRFPHHENERAQALAEGREFARLWFHTGMLEVGGEKMSKSLGNVRNLLDLVEEYDPRAFRLLVLRSHYRSPMDVSDDALKDATAGLERLDSFARRFRHLAEASGSGSGGVVPDEAALDRFRELMDDDLSTPAAVALLFDLGRRANAAGDEAAAAAAFEIAGALGLELRTEAADIGEDALALARERDEARAAKDWATADALRDQLIALGYEVADTPSGTELHRR